MSEVHTPFQIRKGMVLQRNWKAGLESPINAFPILGDYFVVTLIREDGYVEMNCRDKPYLGIAYRRELITDEWFIPD